MKNSSGNKLKNIILGLTAATLLSGGVKAYHNSISQNDISKALAAGNEIKNEQIIFSKDSSPVETLNNRTFFGSNIKDKFEEATESEDEKEIVEEKQEESNSEIATPFKPAEQTPAEKITDDVKSEIEDTFHEIERTPNISKKTELTDTMFRGAPDEIWKISGLIGFSALLGAGLITAGIVIGTKKSRKNKAILNDAKYFVGSEYIEKLNTLTTSSKQIDKYDKKIAEYIDMANNANLRNKNKFLEKARNLRTSDNYIALKNFKKQLIAQINYLVEKNTTINPEKLNYLKNYAKFSKKIFTIPSSDNKLLANKLLRNVKKHNLLSEKMKKSEKSTLKENIEYLEDKIIINLHKATDLTGINKVALNAALNNSNRKDESCIKEHIKNVRDFAIYLKSSKKNYNLYKSLLYKTLKVEYYNSINKNKKAGKIENDVLKIKNKLKKSDPRADLKYYGYVNAIKNVPINPVRFISSNLKNEELNDFFDKVTSSYLNKDKFLYETTITYKIKDDIYSFICSFDNKEAINLVKAKFIASAPENFEFITITEKTINYKNEQPKTIKTILDKQKNATLYREVLDLKKSKELVLDFENLIENKTDILNNDKAFNSEKVDLSSEKTKNTEKQSTMQNKNESSSISNTNVNRMINLMKDNGMNL